MDDSETKKTAEELTDEELDKVAGGRSVIITNDPPPHGIAMPGPPGAIGGKTGGAV